MGSNKLQTQSAGLFSNKTQPAPSSHVPGILRGVSLALHRGPTWPKINLVS